MEQNEKEVLLGKTPQELKAVAADVQLKPFAATQLCSWLYEKRVGDFGAMTNLSKASREALSQRYITGYESPLSVAVSADGTKKYLFRVGGVSTPTAVEAVMIPSGDRSTLCVSSQAGCKMGCRFCMTGRQGFHGNLSCAQILNQFLSIPESESLTNAVFMGMGEPLDNFDEVMKAIEVLTAPWGLGWSPKRITLSTIGVLPALKKYLEQTKCHLAVSLHNPFPEERAEMMPVQKAWDLREVVTLLRQYDFSGQRRVSFEYTMFSGWNDTKRHADALVRLLDGLECRVNLIRFHEIPDFPYKCSPDITMQEFQQRLSNHGVNCTIRASRGEDILAACGLLAGKVNGCPATE